MEEDTIKREDYAPITQWLREYIERHPTMMHAVGLTDLLDNIDALHKSLERKNAGMRDFCERVEQAAQAREGVTLWGVDYMPLPLDADGEYIHIGDVMENLREDLEPKLHHRFKVYGIQYRDYGQVCALTEDGYPSTLYRANECRHYHAPTVADVLREFAQAMAENSDMYVSEAIDADEREAADEEAIERFAKRLQLAEVDE